ncbi:MAG: hypothetical protein J2P37_24695, partial [Ktedonobacteraceae bacterium]|nr:hypothetical protein [Ktedonobacteraceae bacterium]
MNDTTEFWAVLEGDDATHEQNAELLGEVLACARRTRQQQAEPVEVCAILLRAPEAELPSLAGLRGVQRLYLHEHQELKYYTTGAYVEALRWLLSIRRPPTLIALSAAANGRDLAARLATRLRLPLAPNCLSLDIRSDAIFALQALYEGRAYAQT